MPPMRGLFFFSSRRRHTRYIGDWSSDVCSSDLPSISFQPLAKADIMKLTERGAASLNSTVYLSRALISLTALNSGVRGMLMPEGGFEIGRASCRERV